MTDFFNSIFVAIFNIVAFLIHLILLPIDALISTYIPSLDDAFTSIASYLTIIFTNMGWVLSITGIPSGIIALVVAYTIFKLTLPINVWFLKLAVGWWNKLKP